MRNDDEPEVARDSQSGVHEEIPMNRSMIRDTTTRYLIVLLLSLAACSTPAADDADTSGTALSGDPKRAEPAAVRLTHANCEVDRLQNAEDRLVWGESAPFRCIPIGELEYKAAFLLPASDAYSIRPTHRKRSRWLDLSIVDERGWSDRDRALYGNADRPFLVREATSVVAYHARVDVSADDLTVMTISNMSALAVSSDLKPVEARVRSWGGGFIEATWKGGGKDLRGEPLEPRSCAANVVLRAAKGGMLPNDDGTESYELPEVVAFLCDPGQ